MPKLNAQGRSSSRKVSKPVQYIPNTQGFGVNHDYATRTNAPRAAANPNVPETPVGIAAFDFELVDGDEVGLADDADDEVVPAAAAATFNEDGVAEAGTISEDTATTVRVVVMVLSPARTSKGAVTARRRVVKCILPVS